MVREVIAGMDTFNTPANSGIRDQGSGSRVLDRVLACELSQIIEGDFVPHEREVLHELTLSRRV